MFPLFRAVVLSPWYSGDPVLCRLRPKRGGNAPPGTFNTVIAPGKEIDIAINSNTDLPEVLFLSLGENSSRILSDISRQSKNLGICGVRTMHLSMRKAG